MNSRVQRTMLPVQQKLLIIYLLIFLKINKAIEVDKMFTVNTTEFKRKITTSILQVNISPIMKIFIHYKRAKIIL